MEKVNNIIRLTEKEFEDLIKGTLHESISRILSEELDFDFDNYLNNHDFGPEEYDFSFNNQKFLDTGNHKICEGLLKSYDLDRVKNAFCGKFNLPEEKFVIQKRENNENTVNICTVKLPHNTRKEEIGIYDKFMETCGYHRYVNPQYKNQEVWLGYEPHFSKVITPVIREKYKYLYHATPTVHLNKILQQGLVPRSKNGLFFYPDRIYCMGGRISKEESKALGNIKRERAKTKPHDDNSYTLISIDVSKLPAGIKFYADPMAPNAFFTHENIPPHIIKPIMTF